MKSAPSITLTRCSKWNSWNEIQGRCVTAPAIMQMVISSHANYYQTAKRKIKKHCVPVFLNLFFLFFSFFAPHYIFWKKGKKNNPWNQLVREMQRTSICSEPHLNLALLWGQGGNEGEGGVWMFLSEGAFLTVSKIKGLTFLQCSNGGGRVTGSWIRWFTNVPIFSSPRSSAQRLRLLEWCFYAT